MSTKPYNPFKIGEVEIPATVVFHVLMAWKGMPGAPQKVAILPIPKIPPEYEIARRVAPNYAICLGCYRIAGWLDGGKILRECSKCHGSGAYFGDFWSRLGAYSSIMSPWATDAVVAAVIGTVLDFNKGKLKLPSGAFKNERTK